MRALYTAATGMMAQELNVQVISNNIANVRTNGYKRQRVHFQDLLYEHMRRAGSATSDQGTQAPAGVFVGSGVKTAATGRVMAQGNITSTEKEYDLAVRGEGYFRIRMPDGRTAYTRDGSFDLDSQGQLVTKDGYIVEPGVTVPQNARGVTISAQGQVQALIPGQTQPQDLGQIQLARFVNKVGSSRSATTSSSRRRLRARRWTAIPAAKASGRSSSPISRNRTSTPWWRSRP